MESPEDGTSWLRDAVFYEIYPQSFADSDGDGGDLPGALAHLDHLAWLGVDAVWFNPGLSSPFRDAGYDVSDFLAIAPRYGTNNDMVVFVEAARRGGIRVLLDLVAGHTSVEHASFRASAADGGDDRFIWADRPGPTSCPPPGPRSGYYVKNFFDEQPALNYGYAGSIPSGRGDSPSTPRGRRPTGPRSGRSSATGVTAVSPVSVSTWPTRWSRTIPGMRGRPSCGGSCASGWPSLTRARCCSRRANGGLPATSGARRLRRGLVRGEQQERGAVQQRRRRRAAVAARAPRLLLRRRRCRRGGRRAGPEHVPAVVGGAPVRCGGNGLVIVPSSDHDYSRLVTGSRTQEQLGAAFAFLLTWGSVPSVYYGDEIGMRYVDGLADHEGSVCSPATTVPAAGPRCSGTTPCPTRVSPPRRPTGSTCGRTQHGLVRRSPPSATIPTLP